MLLNKIEFFLVNNPIRAFIQDKYEFKRIRKFTNLGENKEVLEIGCGNGTGAKLIMKHFNPKKINAVDLDKKMIEIAKKRINSDEISFSVGNASKLRFNDRQFDAIFDFGIIHHIPNWKDCLRELRRVLKPGGQIIIEDLSIETFENFIGKIYRKHLVHPYKEMYRRDEFVKYLEKLGFKIIIDKSYNPLGLMKHFVVVAIKS